MHVIASEGPKLRRLVSSSLDGHRDAEDIVQWAINEFAGVERYASIAADDFAAHLTQRVRFKVLNYVKRGLGAHPSIDVGQWDITEEQSVNVSFADSLSEPPVDMDTYMDIRVAIESLSARDRFLAVFVLIQGHTQAEAAVALDLSQPRVLRLIEKMKNKLQKKLSEYA